MKCPRCGLEVPEAVPRCGGCGFSVHDLARRLRSVADRDGSVNDFSGLLTDGERVSLAERLERFSAQAGGEIVLPLPSLSLGRRTNPYLS